MSSSRDSFAIVCPTLGRSHLLEPLAKNIATTLRSPYTLMFVIDRDDRDTKRTLSAHGLKWTVCNGTYPEKINAGVVATREPFIVLANDDVVFHKGWRRAALRAFRNGVCVVGPSDLSPATENGDHATMPIVRRSYIRNPGAAWRETGTALHEGYHHNFSETELWALALDRGVAKFVPDCVIEHCHPDWGKGNLDETYEKGARQNFNEDAALFADRLARWRES